MCSCDADPPEFYSERLRRARKPHRCTECATKIEPGDMYRHASGKWDGGISSYATCVTCVAALELALNSEIFDCYPAFGEMLACVDEFMIDIRSDVRGKAKARRDAAIALLTWRRDTLRKIKARVLKEFAA